MDIKTQSGAIAKARVVYELTKLGYHIFNQVTGKAPFDLVAYKDNKLLRITVKSCSKEASKLGNYQIEVGRVRSNKKENKIYKFSKEECDILAIYITEIDTVFYLSSSDYDQKRSIFINRRVAQVAL